MPLLDFSDIIVDPDFATTFSVIRVSETVGATGRAALAEAQTDNIVGIIVFDSKGVQPDETGKMGSRQIVCITQFRLREEAPGNQPDVVLYDGVRFTVNKVEPWTKFGAGFVKANCEAQKAGIPNIT